MFTLVYFLIATALCGFAIYRKPDWCAGALALALIASMGVSMLNVWSVIPFAAAIDAVIVMLMLALWSHYVSMRAWAVGGIGLTKVGISMLQYSYDPHFYSWAYFIAINAGFLVQIIIAGGFCDGVGARLDNMFRQLFPRRHSLLRNGDG